MKTKEALTNLFATAKGIVDADYTLDGMQFKEAVKEPLEKMIKFIINWKSGDRASVHLYNKDSLPKMVKCSQLKDVTVCMAEKIEKLRERVEDLEVRVSMMKHDNWGDRSWRRNYEPYYLNSPTCKSNTTSSEQNLSSPTMGLYSTDLRPAREPEPEKARCAVPGVPTTGEPIEEAMRDAFGDGYVDQAPSDAKVDTRE